MEALARATGLSRATLYRRCGGRRALFEGLAAAGVAVGDLSEARERVLAAARVVFGRAGFDGATIEAIAAEANVGPATIYRHFGDKDGLVAAFIEDLPARRALREGASRPGDDLGADLVRMATAMLASFRDDPLVRLTMLEKLRGGSLMPRIRGRSPTHTLPSIARLLSAHVEAGRLPPCDVRFLAQAFGGLLMAFGIIGPLFEGQAIVDPEGLARRTTEVFLHGALGSKGQPKRGR
jgi:AcrR family transcriptional regulator